MQRWEQTLGLPIHRLLVGKNASVWALRSELDAWYLSRDPYKELEDPAADDPSQPTQPPVIPAPSPTPITPNPVAPVVQDIVAPPDPEDRAATKWGLPWKIGAVAAGILLCALAYLSLPTQIPGQSGTRTDPVPKKIRLFVRPLYNCSADGEGGFAEGLTNEINTQIGRLDPHRLGVIAPTTAKLYCKHSIPDLVRALSVDYILEGSVQRVDKQVRIDVQLILASDQTPVWAESYTDTVGDILKVQDRVSADVARRLLVQLSSKASQTVPPPIDIVGYDAYLAGRLAWTRRDFPVALAEFQQAAQLLPTYAPAHSGLAAVYAVIGQAPNDGLQPKDAAALALAEARSALQLDPGNAESHAVLGSIALHYDWDFPKAEREFQEAIRLEPGNATAHQWLGQYYMMMERPQEAQAETNQALNLDPASPIFITARAEGLYYARDFDATLAHAQIAVKQFPEFVLGEFWLGSAYREKGMYAESLAHFNRALQLAPNNPALIMAYGNALAKSGDKSGALNALALLEALSHQRYVPAIYFAGIYTGLGDLNNAFASLQTAVQQRNDRLIYLRVDPLSDPLRSDPRFAALMQQVNTPIQH